MTGIPVSIIVAVARNGVIGVNGHMPWRSSADLAHFRQVTLGSAIIMGRRTWESLPRRPLPGRYNVVVSRGDPEIEGGTLCADPDEALDVARIWCETSRSEQIFVVGGASLYAWALPLAGRIYLTEVDCTPDGDVFFPTADLKRQWRQMEAPRVVPADEKGPTVVFRTMIRRNPSPPGEVSA